MSNLGTFTGFPLLPLEIRFMIWEYAFIPQIISFRVEALGRDEDATTPPSHDLINRLSLDFSRELTRSYPNGLCVPIDIPSQGVFQASQEPRHLAFKLGYQTMPLQKQSRRVRLFIWNPAKDFISFPPFSYHEHVKGPPLIVALYWPRIFALQYKAQAPLVQNMVVPTSYYYRSHAGIRWFHTTIIKYTALRQLVVVVDEAHERQKVRCLMGRNMTEEPLLGHWKIPGAIVQSMVDLGHSYPHLKLPNPDVRVVADNSHILTSQSLDIALSCNPCPYLDMGREPSESSATQVSSSSAAEITQAAGYY